MSRRRETIPAGRVLTGHIFRVRSGHGYAFSDEPPPAAPEPVRRPARVAQMLGLAHRIEEAIERGEYRDRADAARQLGLTRARVTQLLDLLLLAPDIQEEIVFLKAVDGVEPLSERALRGVVRHASWTEQRRAWNASSFSLDMRAASVPTVHRGYDARRRALVEGDG